MSANVAVGCGRAKGFAGGCSEVRGAAKVKNLGESEAEKCSTGVVWGKSNSFGGKLGLEWLPGQS